MSFEYKPKEKYIAFLDVLGFSSLVERGNKQKLDDYFSILEEAFETLDRRAKHLKKFIISDSIILTAADTEQNFLDMLSTISALQATLSACGIWIRGGVTFGEIDDENNKNIIVGTGYIRAYLLEQQAIFPRVIIDPSILAKMNLNRRQFYEKYDNHQMRDPLKAKKIHDYGFYNHKRYTDEDAIFICYANLVFVQSFLTNNNHDRNNTYLHIKQGLYGDQKHYHKYLWLRKYFLECLEELDHHTDNNFPQKGIINNLIRDFMAL